MSLTKELIEQERLQVQTGRWRDVHLHQEGTFLRAYEWSANLLSAFHDGMCRCCGIAGETPTSLSAEMLLPAVKGDVPQK